MPASEPSAGTRGEREDHAEHARRDQGRVAVRASGTRRTRSRRPCRPSRRGTARSSGPRIAPRPRRSPSTASAVVMPRVPHRERSPSRRRARARSTPAAAEHAGDVGRADVAAAVLADVDAAAARRADSRTGSNPPEAEHHEHERRAEHALGRHGRRRPPASDLLDRGRARQPGGQACRGTRGRRCVVTIRPSRIATMPRSSRRRISRPKPCLSAIAAAGSWIGLERIVARLGAAPACARRRADRCAARTAACRSRRGDSASPGTSTPSQNDDGAEEHRAGRRRGSDRSASRAAPRPGPGAGRERRRGARAASRSARWRREQQERAPGGDREQLQHAVGGGGGEAIGRPARQIARHVEHRLARVVERRGDEQLVGVVEAEPRRGYRRSRRRRRASPR